jgi:hypothetical protein
VILINNKEFFVLRQVSAHQTILLKTEKSNFCSIRGKLTGFLVSKNPNYQ